MHRLQQEIRSAFKSYDEIDGTSTQPLKYLNAVALEAMRIYPPLPFALPRVVPPGGDTVEGHFLPEGVSIGNPLPSLLTEPAFRMILTFISTDGRFREPARGQLGCEEFPRSVGIPARALAW